MFPVLIKTQLQQNQCFKIYPAFLAHLSNKKGQKISHLNSKGNYSNLYDKVLALCSFYTCCFIAHAKYSKN